MNRIVNRNAERTGFQTPSYHPTIDLRSDVVFVYGLDENLAERVKEWRGRGYRTHFMTGAAWGHYQEYLDGRFDGRTHFHEAQVARSGERVDHGNEIFYFVPTPSYTEYLKSVAERAVDAGVDAIHLEEPEFWSRSGYSESFKALWQQHYGTTWQPPHSSAAAWNAAARLKYQLYTDCLENVFGHAKDYAARHGRTLGCYVDSHSLINYAQWGIVSPESNLAHLKSCDGYVCQVWTGTSRTPNHYQGQRAERTFLTAYLEYAQMAAMVLATGRKVWFLADPIEDDPRYDWEDYRRNYHLTLVASLLNAEVNQYEVMPWPYRVFNGAYPSHAPHEQQSHIPADYATELTLLANVLAEMPAAAESKVDGLGGIGLCIADSLLFERGFEEPEQVMLRKPGDPAPPDQIYRIKPGGNPELDGFFGLALPLLQRGIPLRLAHLEHAGLPGYLDGFDLLVLSYDCMKPPSAETHRALTEWVKAGGVLGVVGSSDVLPFDETDSWWRQQSPVCCKPIDHLWRLLNVHPEGELVRVGQGAVLALNIPAGQLAHQPALEAAYLDALRKIHAASRAGVGAWRESALLRVARGPYLAAAVPPESKVESKPIVIAGKFINLLTGDLPLCENPTLTAGQVCLLFDLSKAPAEAGVIAAAGRVESATWDERSCVLRLAGPAQTEGLLVLNLPARPEQVTVGGSLQADWAWDAANCLARIHYPGMPEGIEITASW